jgi:hypothetical protein
MGMVGEVVVGVGEMVVRVGEVDYSCVWFDHVFWEGVEGAQALKELRDSGCVDRDVGKALSGGLYSREVVNKGVSHGCCSWGLLESNEVPPHPVRQTCPEGGLLVSYLPCYPLQLDG